MKIRKYHSMQGANELTAMQCLHEIFDEESDPCGGNSWLDVRDNYYKCENERNRLDAILSSREID